MSDEPYALPRASSSHVNAMTTTMSAPPAPRARAELNVPPRPPLPAMPAATAARIASPPQGWTIAAPGPPAAPRRSAEFGARVWAALRTPRVLLGIYVVVLALIALWPVPVDSGAGPMLRLVSRVIPILTYERIEFGANILLFVPLGVLLALILTQRYLVVPIALVATVTIESLQALLIDRRTPSVLDIIANLAGAAIGLLIVALVEWRRSRRRL